MKKTSLLLGISLSATLFALASATAQTSATWITETISSGAIASWNNGGNWVGGTAPVASGTYNLDFSNETITTTTRTLTNNIANLSLNQMILGRSINPTAGALNYSGSSVTWVKDGSSNNPQLTLNLASTGNNQININSSIASGATLQINGAGSGSIIIAGVISGSGGVNYNKSGGTFQSNGANTFTGDFTLSAGQLVLTTSSSGTPGNVTNGPLGRGNVVINGGIIRSTAAATRQLDNNVQIGGNFQVGLATFNRSITLTGGVLLTGTGVTRTITGAYDAFDASSGTLTLSGNITESGTGNGLTFATSGTVQASNHFVLGGSNTYTGNTTINVGTLVLANTSNTKFVIGASGINNQILGNGTIQLDGNFTFDLSGAGTTLGNSWDIVHTATLAETFGSTFSVADFISVNSTLWSKSIGSGKFYNFDESTGLLSVTTVPEPSTWALIGLGLTCALILRRRRA